MTKMNREEAVEFAQFVAMKDGVDFENGEGKVVVFKNAVAVMEQSEDDPESVQMQFIMSNYTDAREIEVKDEMSIKEMMMAMFFGE